VCVFVCVCVAIVCLRERGMYVCVEKDKNDAAVY